MFHPFHLSDRQGYKLLNIFNNQNLSLILLFSFFLTLNMLNNSMKSKQVSLSQEGGGEIETVSLKIVISFKSYLSRFTDIKQHKNLGGAVIVVVVVPGQ